MDNRVGYYRRSRQNFAVIVYMVTVLWLLLGLAQWLVVSLVDVITELFRSYAWVGLIFFLLSIIFVFIFIFIEDLRFVTCLNLVITILIVEFAIIGVFGLAAKSQTFEIVFWFIICFLLIFLSIFIGSIIPHDLTMDVVILFVASFVFLIAAVFMIMLQYITYYKYPFILFQIFISAIILSFVMYHAQTINGGRFAEMRVNDYYLATIILFFDFFVLFLMTFYSQIYFRVIDRMCGKYNYTTTTENTNRGTTTVAP